MKHFKIRCSQIGKIMTNPRSKTELLSKTTMDYVQTIRKEEIYKRREEIYSKYMDKGIQMEQEAIELAAQHMGWGLVFKNEEQFENDFMTGTPDVILADKVIDVKCPWNCFTFPLFDTEPDKGYWWQLQGYMALTDKQNAQLIYCLMDMPDDLLENELYFAMKRNGMIDLETEQEEAVRAYHSYGDVPIKNRVKVFDIVRDDQAIKSIYERVEQCRDYYLTLI